MDVITAYTDAKATLRYIIKSFHLYPLVVNAYSGEREV